MENSGLFEEMLRLLKGALSRIPEHRTGSNTLFEIEDAGLAAFAVFFMQSPSFLAHQRDMQRKKRKNNARSLFGVQKIPCDEQVRNLLDPPDPAQLGELFWDTYALLAAKGHLQGYAGVGGTRLISLDGSQYFSSQKIHCENCRVQEQDQKVIYSHQVMAAVLCAPDVMGHIGWSE